MTLDQILAAYPGITYAEVVRRGLHHDDGTERRSPHAAEDIAGADFGPGVGAALDQDDSEGDDNEA